MTHPNDQPCPFAKDGNPHGILGTCCSFRGSTLALYLLALGLTPPALDLHKDKSPDEAIAFGEALRRLSIETRRMFFKVQREAGHDPSPSDSLTIKVPGTRWEFSTNEPLTELEAAADWHEKVGRMGFGVKAWF